MLRGGDFATIRAAFPDVAVDISNPQSLSAQTYAGEVGDHIGHLVNSVRMEMPGKTGWPKVYILNRYRSRDMMPKSGHTFTVVALYGRKGQKLRQAVLVLHDSNRLTRKVFDNKQREKLSKGYKLARRK